MEDDGMPTPLLALAVGMSEISVLAGKTEKVRERN